MQCRQCGYWLWGLAERRCPECGAPFAPGDYEFVADSVAFGCPHCGQVYYGTDEKGHLEPRAFTCVGCESPIEMDEMVLRPAADLAASDTGRRDNPWRQRSELGRVSAWWRTVGRAMGAPGRLMRGGTPGGAAEAVMFALINVTLAAALGSGVVIGGWFAVMGVMMGGAAGLVMLLPMAVMVLAGILVPLLYLLVWGLVTHGMLRLIAQPAGGIGRTFEALGYTSGVTAIAMVPCLGSYLVLPAWGWWSVAAIFAVREGQGVSGGRATSAVLVAPALTVITSMGLMVALFISAQSFRSQMAAGAGAHHQIVQVTITLAPKLRSAVRSASGPLPDHAIEWIADGHLSPGLLCVSGSGTTPSGVRVAGTTLARFAAADPARQRELVRRAEADLAPADAPYRLADVIFCHRGFDPGGHPADAWLALVWPALSGGPGASAPPSGRGSAAAPSGWIGVIHLDGTTDFLPAGGFGARLAAENARRRGWGLPPIPDPATIQSAGTPPPASRPAP